MLTFDIIITVIFVIAYFNRPAFLVGDGLIVPLFMFFAGWASAAVVGAIGLPILAVVMFFATVIDLGLAMWSNYQSAR